MSHMAITTEDRGDAICNFLVTLLDLRGIAHEDYLESSGMVVLNNHLYLYYTGSSVNVIDLRGPASKIISFTNFIGIVRYLEENQ